MITTFRGIYAFLSNFYQCHIEFEGVVYPTLEHAYQAAKTLDPGERIGIKICNTPGEAKRYGKQLTLRPDWEQVKDEIMLSLLRQKFSYPHLELALEYTGDEEIQHQNYWHDNYWGKCICDRCRKKPHQDKLGKMLMQVRQELKEASSQ